MRFLACLTTILTLWAGSALAQSPATPASSAFSGIDDSIAALSKITGLKPVKKVPYDTLDKSRLKRYLEQRVKEELKPEEIRAEELTLKKFGLVPGDFDLRGTTVELLTEQAAAFYDYREKKLYLMQSSTPGAQDLFVFHELAHALADQHFDLAKYIRKGKNDDASLARMAVMEGQATWLMFEFMAQKMGQSLKTAPGMIDLLSRSTGDEFASQYPVLSGAPLYIRASLLFPYMDGLRFQNALVAKLDKAGFAKPFRTAPVSTQQILHPEKYLDGVQPARIDLPKMTDARAWTTLAEGTVGEFDHKVLIEQYAGKEESARLSPGWRGASFALLENKHTKRVALLYASDWQDSQTARDVFAAYRRVLQGKWKNMKMDRETDSTLSGSGDDGRFQVVLSGTHLVSAEGMASGDDVKLSPELAAAAAVH